MKTSEDEIKNQMEDADIKVETDTLIAKIGKLEWKINPLGHTKNVRDSLLQIQDDFKKAMTDLIQKDAGEKEKSDLVEKINRQIMELSVIGFKYDKVANDIQAGPVAIDFLTKELTAFLVVKGGKVGMKHSQMLSNLIDLAISNGSLDLNKLSKVSKSSGAQEPTSSKSTDSSPDEK